MAEQETSSFFVLTDFLQVWHSHEDNHVHQEQSVPGSSAVQRSCQCTAGQTGMVMFSCMSNRIVPVLDFQTLYES